MNDDALPPLDAALIWMPEPDGSYLMRLRRDVFTPLSTTGKLYLGETIECYALENPLRPIKVPQRTAIPAGRYQVIVDFSNRFQRNMPLLVSVPGFSGIRIHPGNSAHDTEGCLLVGRTRGFDWVGDSRVAFDALFPKIIAATAKAKLFIEITNEEAAS